MQLYTFYFICKLLYIFRAVSPPIIRSTNNCIYLKNKRPTLYHLLFYFTSYVLNMFRTLIYIHHQELATILFNYHIGCIVLGSMCVGVSVWLGWSGIRVAG